MEKPNIKIKGVKYYRLRDIEKAWSRATDKSDFWPDCPCNLTGFSCVIHGFTPFTYKQFQKIPY